MSENEILQRVIENDSKVISHLYREHHKGFIAFILKNYPGFGVDEAEDIFSDCFQILCANIKSGKLATLTSSIKSYLYKIGWRLAWDEHHRKDRAIGKTLPEKTELPEYDGNEFETKTFYLIQTVGKLTEPCKTLLDLFWIQQKSDKDIVSLTGYSSPDTVKNQRSRCMKMLKKEFLNKLLANSLITISEKNRLTGE